MSVILYKIYHDRTILSEKDNWESVLEKGKAAFIGIACPTSSSSDAKACDKALSIGGQSFIKRPTDKDIAVDMIDEFINNSIYQLQLPHSSSLCSTAFMYLFKGVIQFSLTGFSRIYCFTDGRLQGCLVSEGGSFYGKSAYVSCERFEPLKLTNGNQECILITSDERLNISEDEVLELYQKNFENFDGLFDICGLEKIKTAMLVKLPQKPKGFPFFRGR